MSGNEILQEALSRFRSGGDVSPSFAELFFDALIAETDEHLIAEIFRAWEAKGTTDDELFSLTSLLRSRMKRVNSRHATFVDAVGTGGSKAKTFNVSTAAAFVIAGVGVPVAKHGNRAATSNSGSADVLTELGVKADIEPEHAERCLNELDICFMFAPKFHSLSPTLGKVRRELGFPTIFNNLGPLCNPASAPHQIIGVWHNDLVEKTANVLARLGTKKSWIVHGQDGLDEITLRSKTFIAEVCRDKVVRFEITPSDFGITNNDAVMPCPFSPIESASLIQDILANRRKGEASENLVLVNAAAAIYVTGTTDSLSDALELARNSITGGHAATKLKELAAETNK